MVLFAVYMLNMHTYRYGEGEGERGGGGRVQGGRGKGVSAAVVCVWLFASSCLHMYIFQITSVFIDLQFHLFRRYRRNQLYSESQELGQIFLVIRIYNSINFASHWE